MKIDFQKMNGLVPAIVQDIDSQKVLMLAYMNEEAYQRTLESGKVTFYSRSRKCLWTKGETSGNYLLMKDMLLDCDGDALLVKAQPTGPVCHTGEDTCFFERNEYQRDFLRTLEDLIAQRKKDRPPNSYTTTLFEKGIKTIARKVGEEATEVLIEALAGDQTRLKDESADLLYHLLVLLQSRDIALDEVITVLEKRHASAGAKQES
jgi:phosphoribosyl-AMP cyclohydrolase / phosphoribosyl-ATP pyrophosphohydrolase